MEKENQRVAVTKRMLQEGLLRLLEQKDLDKINITELCKESGINRITFYRHYETPHDVLIELERNLLKERQPARKPPKSLPEIRHHLEDTCAFLETNSNLLRIMVRNNTDDDLYGLFREIFQEIQTDGALKQVFGSMDSDTLEILSVFHAGGAYMILRQWLLGNIQKSAKELADIFFQLLCNTDWGDINRQLRLLSDGNS